MGSLRSELLPGTFVIVDQFIDMTFKRETSFFEKDCVVHVSLAKPVCSRMGHQLEQQAKKLKILTKRNGTYLAMEGPQFSTKAESRLYQHWGCDVIGMTNMPEAKLAREAEMCYASLVMVTDFDCWNPEYEHVNAQQVLDVMKNNVKNAISLIAKLIPKLHADTKIQQCNCQFALDFGLVTAKEAIDVQFIDKMKPILKRVLGGAS